MEPSIQCIVEEIHCLPSFRQDENYLFARYSGGETESNLHPRRSALLLIPSVALGIVNPRNAEARAGEPAKVKGVSDFAADFMGCQDERTNGCRDGRTEQSLYEKESASIVTARTARVSAEWKRLETQVPYTFVHAAPSLHPHASARITLVSLRPDCIAAFQKQGYTCLHTPAPGLHACVPPLLRDP